MKPGFGKAKGKKKTKQTKKKNKQAKNKPIKSDGGDDAMMDVADPAPAEQQQVRGSCHAPVHSMLARAGLLPPCSILARAGPLPPCSS